jgi:hypothetical protein
MALSVGSLGGVRLVLPDGRWRSFAVTVSTVIASPTRTVRLSTANIAALNIWLKITSLTFLGRGAGTAV